MIRQIVAVGMAASGVIALTSCTKPAPEVTIWSPDSSVIAPATCWAEDSTPSQALTQCIENAASANPAELPTLAVAGGNTLGINVESEVAEAGWQPSVDGQPITSDVLNQTYFRLTLPEGRALPPDGLILSVRARGTGGTSDRGVWVFRIVSNGIV